MTSLAIFNGLYPAITESSSSINRASTKVSDRIESRIDIIQIGDNVTDVEVWIKNVGTTEIVSISRTDIFFGPTGDFYRVDYGGSTRPYWEYQLEGNNTEWGQAVTIKVTIHPTVSLTTGTYMMKAVLPNGISVQTTYGVD